MTVQRRALITQIATTAGVIVFGMLAANVSSAFVVGIIFSGVIGGVALMAISCPKCSFPATFREHEAFGSKIQAFSPFLPSACRNCGYPFNERPPAT